MRRRESKCVCVCVCVLHVASSKSKLDVDATTLAPGLRVRSLKEENPYKSVNYFAFPVKIDTWGSLGEFHSNFSFAKACDEITLIRIVDRLSLTKRFDSNAAGFFINPTNFSCVRHRVEMNRFVN